MKVKPIRNVKDIRAIKRILANSPRNYALFVIGINTNLRASDILSFTTDQARNLKLGDEVVLKEKKTGKERRITVNVEVLDAVMLLLNSWKTAGQTFIDNAPLLVGQRSKKPCQHFRGWSVNGAPPLTSRGTMAATPCGRPSAIINALGGHSIVVRSSMLVYNREKSQNLFARRQFL